MEFISAGVLVTVDSRQVYRVINIEELKKKRGNKQSKGNDT